MDIRVTGGQKLTGTVSPSGSKNSAVCLIPATLLFDRPVTLTNVPEITDVERLTRILTKLGSKIEWNKKEHALTIDNSQVRFTDLDQEDLGNMKGTSLLWGPMLARFKKVQFNDLPGGCTLGVRPLDAHFDAFKKLGVTISENTTRAVMDASKTAAGEVWLIEMSVTATENLIMLATSLKGTTRIVGAASEPQVQDLCHFLVSAGATIRGIGSSILEIDGGEPLEAHLYEMFPDHYEIATFLAFGAATGGDITVTHALPQHFSHIDHVFSQFGLVTEYKNGTVCLRNTEQIIINPHSQKRQLTVRAQPWPGLPVDLLPIFIPLALQSKEGQVLFHNWMYEAGLFWTSELTKLNGNVIMCDPHRVIVSGGNKLKGTTLEAPYIIRAVVAMVMSAMSAEGDSTILNADALFRGHPHFEENLRKLGAKIEVTKE